MKFAIAILASLFAAVQAQERVNGALFRDPIELP